MQISTHKYSKPYKRKIHLGKDEWSYRIAGYIVCIRNHLGTMTIKTDIFEVLDIYEADWFGYNNEFPSSIDIPAGPSVTPSDIKKFIINKGLAI